MSPHPREHEGDFDRRWTAAGATAEERAAIRRKVEASSPVPEQRAPLMERIAWSAIEARISERHAARTRRRVQLAAAGAALVLALVAGAMIPGPGAGHEDKRPTPAGAGAASGVALTREARSGCDPAAPAGGPCLAPEGPGELRTVELIPSAEGDVALAPGSRAHRAPGGQVQLDVGTLRAEIRPRPPGAPPLVFHAGDIAIEVIGTVFALHVEGGVGVVRVYEGAVMLHPDIGPAVRVGASEPALPAGRVWPPADVEATDRWGREAAIRRSEQGPRALAGAEASTALVAGGGPGRKDDASAWSTSRGAPAHEGAPTGAGRDASGARRGEVEASGREVPGTRPPGHAPARRAELEEYRAAEDLLRSGRPRAAADAFRRYLARHPEGSLREDAELSLLESLHGARASAALRRETKGWLRRHPYDPRRGEVRSLLDDDQ